MTARYRAIAEYIRTSGSGVILLSATPYNKTYQDLSNQLRLFIAEGHDLGVRPEAYLRELARASGNRGDGELAFNRKHPQTPVRSLAAFDWSEHPDDWRELMRLYLVRRTRTFIKANYAEHDPAKNRYFLLFDDGRRAYFPDRIPKTVRFELRTDADPYARLYSSGVVDTLNALTLPRYGLGNFISDRPKRPADPDEAAALAKLSRAGRRLMGFSRTNLFKRLESSGEAFLLSVKRHILRNFIFVHAIETGQPLPIGTQDAELLDPRFSDDDALSAPAEADGFNDHSTGDFTDDFATDSGEAGGETESAGSTRSVGSTRPTASAGSEAVVQDSSRRYLQNVSGVGGTAVSLAPRRSFQKDAPGQPAP